MSPSESGGLNTLIEKLHLQKLDANQTTNILVDAISMFVALTYSVKAANEIAGVFVLVVSFFLAHRCVFRVCNL